MGLSPLRQLCSYPGVLEAAGAITAHDGDLGLVWVQWLDLKPIFRRGGCSGGIAPSPVLQEGGAPVSAWLCGIFQTLQAGGTVKSVSEEPLMLEVFSLRLPVQSSPSSALTWRSVSPSVRQSWNSAYRGMQMTDDKAMRKPMATAQPGYW